MPEAGAAWWESNLKPDLSQGDVVLDLPFWAPLPSNPPLQKETIPGGRTVWTEVDAPRVDDDGIYYLLARTRRAPGVILTHDCEIDKKRRSSRIQVAILLPLERLHASEKAAVIGQGKYAHLVLPDVPEIGIHYLDFQVQVTLDRRIIDGQRRIASMADAGIKRLGAQLVAYFLRLSP